MPPRLANYYFGRFNILGQYGNKKDYVLVGLQRGYEFYSRENGWGFFDVNVVEYTGIEFVQGFLVKFKPLVDEEIVLPESQELSSEAVSNRVIAKARFILHIPTGIIMYRAASRQISRQQFLLYFPQVFIENHERFFVDAEVQTIDEEMEIFEAMRRFDRILAFSVYLHPSNPDLSDMWKDVDEWIKDINADKYHEYMEAKPSSDGLHIIDNGEIRGKIAMARDGYGNASVTGTVDGKVQVVSTNDNPVTAQAPSGDDTTAETILSYLIDTFRKIRERFHDHEL